MRGLTSMGSGNWPLGARIGDYLWHMVLPTLALVAGGFAGLTMLTKNCFLEEIRKQYVVTARAKGCHRAARAVRPCLPQRHAADRRRLSRRLHRHPVLLGALLVEIVFSLDGLGLLGFEAAIQRDYPVMFGTLYIFTLARAGDADHQRPDVHAYVDPRIDFEARG